MIIDGLTATGATFPGRVVNALVPGNLGSRLFSASFDRDNHTAMTLRNANPNHCNTDRIGVYAYSSTGPNPATTAIPPFCHR
jgi:hypothetical protein